MDLCGCNMPPRILDQLASQERVRGLYIEMFGTPPVSLAVQNTRTELDRISSLLYTNKDNQSRFDIMCKVLVQAGIVYGDTFFFDQNVAQLAAYVDYNATVHADNPLMMHQFCAELDTIYQQMIGDMRNETSLFYRILSLVRQSMDNDGHLQIIYKIWQDYGVPVIAQETAEKNITHFETFVKLCVAERRISSAENEIRLDRFCNILNCIYKQIVEDIAQYDTLHVSSTTAVALDMPPELSWKDLSDVQEGDDIIPENMPFLSEDQMRLAHQQHITRYREEQIREKHDALNNARMSHYVNSLMTDGNNGTKSVATYDAAENQLLANRIRDRELQGVTTGFDLTHSRYHI